MASDPAPHILVVDDHRDIRDGLRRYLTREGLRVSAAADGAEARSLLNGHAVDLAVLDIMMPGEDGLSLCRHVRDHLDLPVILLTAKESETDRVVGLEVGADDYVVKPFSPRELLARIRSVLRRTHALPPQRGSARGHRAHFGGWELDAARREVTTPTGRVVSLSDSEHRLLVAFLTYPQTVLSREQLLDLVHGRDTEAFERSVDILVSRLRRKIEADPKRPQLIQTSRGGGYQFAQEVTWS
ncbi:response regulator [Rhodovibrio salinarum]|uniref:Regulatory protein VirG n=1 Tax=Rhodovibrio salinarum TaxID=1087 RepID=A0A934QLP2_9PROT|nr:response regulator transcription factor [Rhodovibrio salinarum]MBK1699033.1 DNA-binding response regulator [Rhodovibrio salinarum]